VYEIDIGIVFHTEIGFFSTCGKVCGNCGKAKTKSRAILFSTSFAQRLNAFVKPAV
jgi:hypothetical protein